MEKPLNKWEEKLVKEYVLAIRELNSSLINDLIRRGNSDFGTKNNQKLYIRAFNTAFSL
jgi:hypothetical protein